MAWRPLAKNFHTVLLLGGGSRKCDKGKGLGEGCAIQMPSQVVGEWVVRLGPSSSISALPPRSQTGGDNQSLPGQADRRDLLAAGGRRPRPSPRGRWVFFKKINLWV